MIDAIIAFFDANFIVLLLALAAYAVCREVGAVAAAAFGQYFVNAASLSRTYSMSGLDQGCTPIVIFLALLPLLVFATLPSAHSMVSCRQNRTSDASSFLVLFAMIFAALSANHCLLAWHGVPLAGDAAWGALLLASLFTAGSIMLDKLSSKHLPVAAQPSVISPAYSAEMPYEVLAETSPNIASVEVGLDPTSSDDEVPSVRIRILHKPLPEPASSGAYLFNRNEFYIFRHEHLKDLEDLLRREPPGVLEGLHAAISYRLGRTPIAGDQRAFVRAYVSQFRKRIKTSYPAYFAPERFQLLAA